MQKMQVVEMRTGVQKTQLQNAKNRSRKIENIITETTEKKELQNQNSKTTKQKLDCRKYRRKQTKRINSFTRTLEVHIVPNVSMNAKKSNKGGQRN